MMSTIDMIKSQKGQKFLFLNVRSLFGHLNDLQVKFNKTNFYALCFSESWLTNVLPSSMVNIEGYHPIRLDRTGGKRGGGLIVYVRQDLSWEFLPNYSSIMSKDIEILTIIIKRKFQKNLCLSVTYIPPPAT